MATELTPEELPEPDLLACSFAAVHLRLGGVSDSCVIIKAEPAPSATAVVLADKPVKDLKSLVRRLEREKGQIQRDCTSAVLEMKAAVKKKSREVLTSVVAAERAAKQTNVELQRSKSDAKYFRNKAHVLLQSNKELEEQLHVLKKEHKESQLLALRSSRAAQTAAASSSSAKAAYKERASALRSLQNERKQHLDHISALEKLAYVSADLAEQREIEMDAARAEAGELEERLAEAEANAQQLQDDLAENAADRLEGEKLHKTTALITKALASKECALAEAKERLGHLQDEVARLRPPQVSIRLPDDVAADRTKRLYDQQDLDYLYNLFSDRKWNVKHITRALAEASLLKDVFETREVWELRLAWICKEMEQLRQGRWSVDQTIGLMIDAVLSYGDLQQLRVAFSLESSAGHDRSMHRVWLSNPHVHEIDEDGTTVGMRTLRFTRNTYVRMPEPIPPVEKVRLRFKEIEADLKIAVSEDGKIATHRFKDRLVNMHEEHIALGLIHPSCGSTREHVHDVTYCFDAFPVENISVEHAGVFSSSLQVPSQSEAFFRIISCATIKENNAELNRMHSTRKVDKDFNSISTSGKCLGSDGKTPIHFNLLICCDKKALEMLRGCAPGCAWCRCPKERRLAAAGWKLNNEPKTWKAAEAGLAKVCQHAFPEIWDVYAWAHLALPHEKLPRYCSVCKRRPHETVEEYEAELKAVAEQRADTTKAGQARWKAKRSTHGAAHFGQYLHEAPNLMFHMINAIPEIMHLDALNMAKQAWTKGFLVLLNEYFRDVVSGFIKGLGAALSVRAKPDGRTGSAWFKASVWASLVSGTDKVPAGLAGWFASILFYIATDHANKQTAFVSQAVAVGATSEEVMRANFGNKGQQFLDCARLFDAYKAWHDATHLDTPTDADREAVALKLAVTANRMMVAFKTVAKETGKTWVYHIALFIVPRTVRKYESCVAH